MCQLHGQQCFIFVVGQSGNYKMKNCTRNKPEQLMIWTHFESKCLCWSFAPWNRKLYKCTAVDQECKVKHKTAKSLLNLYLILNSFGRCWTTLGSLSTCTALCHPSCDVKVRLKEQGMKHIIYIIYYILSKYLCVTMTSVSESMPHGSPTLMLSPTKLAGPWEWDCLHRPWEWDCPHRPWEWDCSHRPWEWDCLHRPWEWDCPHRPWEWDCPHRPWEWDCPHRPWEWDCPHRVWEWDRPQTLWVGLPTQTPGVGLPTQTLGVGLPTQTLGVGLPTQTLGVGLPTQTLGVGPPTQTLGVGLPTQTLGGTLGVGPPTQTLGVGPPTQTLGVGLPTQSLKTEAKWVKKWSHKKSISFY